MHRSDSAKFRIAIIDSGIDTRHHRLSKASVVSVRISRPGKEWIVESGAEDTLGHGTACAGIIHKHVPDIELVGIKIIEKGRLTREDSLILALKWIAEQDDIRLVYVSMGSTGSPNAELSDICDTLFGQGKMIVASCDNDINRTNYPAAFRSVLGVCSGQVNDGKRYGYTSGGYFVAKGSIQRVATTDDKDLIVTGTSYAAAHFTGIVAETMRTTDCSSEELIESLIRRSDPTVIPMQYQSRTSYNRKPILLNADEQEFVSKELDPGRKLEWVGRVAIFPVAEKEMKHFSEFPSEIRYPVSLKIDYPFSLHDLSRQKESVLRSIPTDEQFEAFDTLVIGYYMDSLWEKNLIFGNKLIDEAIKRNKNFFVYDQRVKSYILSRIEHWGVASPRIYSPLIDEKDYEKFWDSQFLPNPKAPVLMVIGTGSRQGKFTTQLRLREILNKEGYKTGFVSTEPHGELFGANYCFPSGHMRAVRLNANEIVIFTRNLYKALSHYIKPDIIVTGTQSAFIPPDPLASLPVMCAMESVGYLYGALPDLVVCSIDPYDKVDLILKTIRTANYFSNCKVLFFVVSPWTLKANGEKIPVPEDILRERIQYYVAKLKKPVVNMMDKANDSMILKAIEDACS